MTHTDGRLGALFLVGLAALAGCADPNDLPWTVESAHRDFPIAGAHQALACTECHGDEAFAVAAPLCQRCHEAEFDTTRVPVHAEIAATLECETCHTTVAWLPSRYDHSTFAFPVDGAHAAARCAACHAGGVYQGLVTSCVGCHQDAYDAAADPNHVDFGFPTRCEDCHTTAAWSPADFEHAGFELEGAHRTTRCATCHDGRDPLPSGCFDCHADDYAASGHPGFGTDCMPCHTSSAWTPSTFRHDPLFPISRGDHQRFACEDCHTDPTGYAVFACIPCHQRAETDRKHQREGVSGYRYESAACYACHPDGKE